MIRKFLHKCRFNHHPTDIIYMDRSGQLSQRTIFVKHMNEHQVTAFCTLRQQRRIFDLERILAVQKGTFHYEPRFRTVNNF